MQRSLQRTGLARPLAVLFPPRDPASVPPRLADGRFPARYESLDHLRGLAAIGIVLHHAAFIDFSLGTGRVLLFFVISGYCIAASTASCMRRGMTPSRFFIRRVHRIYPPYLLAVLFWAGTRVVKLIRSGDNDLLFRLDGTPRPWTDWLQNVTLTQWVSLVLNPIDHPGANRTLFVATFWSLCYEEQFYLVITGLFALAVAVPRLRIWPMMIGIGALAVGWGLLNPVMVRGIFLEFWISFTLGATAFYRLSVVKDRRQRWMIDAAVGLFALAAFAGLHLDPRVPTDADRSKWVEWLLAAAFYGVLVVLRPVDRRIAGFWPLMPLRAIGRITYSLYLIHQFNLQLIYSATTALLRLAMPGYTPPANPGDRSWYDITVQVILHIGLATAFWLFCEYPFLNRAVDGSGETGGSGERPSGDRDGRATDSLPRPHPPAPVPPEASASRDG